MASKRAKKKTSNERWLVTAWPGMGAVAVTAVVYLLSKLKMREIAEFDAHDLFELDEAAVEGGLIRGARLPRSRLFLAEDAAPGRDIVVFLGEAQPPMGKFALCRRLLDAARGLGVTRVFCFASWVSNMEPSAASRVHGVATDAAGLADLRRQGVTVIDNGRIAGLNGVLLAAAVERGLPGLGLLGEMPSLAYQLPSPSASAAVLRVFSAMAGINLELDELERYGRRMQKQLSSAYQQALKAIADAGPVTSEQPPAADVESPGGMPKEDAELIEKLFVQATKDRAKAFELKTELDRHGVFRQYEDRFLGLFRKPA